MNITEQKKARPLSAYTTSLVVPTNAVDRNFGHRGISVVINITNANGGTITASINLVDSFGNKIALLTSAGLAANATTRLTLYPGLTPVANVVVSDVLPATFCVDIAHTNANAMTYSASYCLLP